MNNFVIVPNFCEMTETIDRVYGSISTGYPEADMVIHDFIRRLNRSADKLEASRKENSELRRELDEAKKEIERLRWINL